MIGYLVRHRQLGLGKIIAAQNRAFTIRFAGSDQIHSLGYAELYQGGTLSREPLGLGSRCRTTMGPCTVGRIVQRPTSPMDPYTYQVALDTGAVQIFSEAELEPIAGGESADPQMRLAGLQVHPYVLFRSRETLRNAYARMMRDAAGLRALLGSRVDLMPHQAFVAATVILDPRRRYILADEVGLGKTIEAGIIMHDLLAQKADARILVLCPGALTQQWLCELYTKFGGQLFILLDLHDPSGIDWAKMRRMIASTSMASFEVGPALERVQWDMIVVDEAHHLLAAPALYALVQRLSRRTSAILLLSAIPAHEREEELLRLLALLEPERYGDLTPESQKQFVMLHEQQPHLGRGLRVLERRIAALESGELTLSDVCSVARKLLDIPVVGHDHNLRQRLDLLEEESSAQCNRALRRASSEAGNPGGPDVAPRIEGIVAAAESSGEFLVEGGHRSADHARLLRSWAHDTADRYRLNRRILRNRRERLVQLEQIASIERRVNLLPFSPTQAELDCSDAVHTLLADASARKDGDFVPAFGRALLQSAASPNCLLKLLSGLERATPAKLSERGHDFLAMGPAIGYADWPFYRDLLLKVVRPVVSASLLRNALSAVIAWRDMGSGAHSRLRALVGFLGDGQADRRKMIVFAGYPGFGDEVSAALGDAFGAGAIASFRAEDDREKKEANVLRFQQDARTWLLVSDESGGEGRNFQFAAELVHADTPWHVARVEQRIGRLDRLGRELVRSDVVSNVIYDDGSAEAGLVQCFDLALEVYRRSISGLEFALREVERTLIARAIDGGCDALLRGMDQLRGVVQRERQRDDAEAVLDEASYEASSAERFRAISRSERMNSSIEGPVVDYMRQLTENRGVRTLDTPFGPGAIWRFQPEKTSFGALPVDREGAEVLVGNHDGTFRRRVAQQVPNLHFFNVSDPLFNAIIRSLDQHVTGRAFAVELIASDRPVWIGIECRFIATFNSKATRENTGLRNRAEALFIPKPLAVFIDLDGRLSSDADTVVALRRRLDSGQRGQTWWDLHDETSALAAALSIEAWPEALRELIDQARMEATRQFSVSFAAPLAAEVARVDAISNMLREAGERGDDDAASNAKAFEGYAAALPDWGVYLDAVGLISINGKLRMGRLR